MLGSARVGGVVSWTVTWNEPVAVLPWASVAVHRTAMVPRGNVDPEAGLQDTATDPSTRSVAEGAKEAEAPDGPVASAIISAGSVSAGGVETWTITSNDPDATFPAASVVEQDTLVGPIGNVEPESGAHWTGTVPSTRAFAETARETPPPH